MGRVDGGDAHQTEKPVGADHFELGDLGFQPVAQQLRAVDGAVEQSLTVADELAAAAVDAQQQQRRGARRLLEILVVDGVEVHRARPGHDEPANEDLWPLRAITSVSPGPRRS
jgi:hypothetical protein